MKNLFGEIFLSLGTDYLRDDLPLNVFMRYFGISYGEEMSELGIYVSKDLMEILDSVDHFFHPHLVTTNVRGKRIDYVRISREHREALSNLQKFGTVRTIATTNSLMQHFLSSYVVSDSGIFCTITLTAQTLFALMKYGKDLERFTERYLDTNDPWYGGTFYTEVKGGSDLGSNETRAKKILDTYFLNGDKKYFASNAGIADGVIVTARMDDSTEGAKGISTFFVPSTRDNGDLNFNIRRLKEKLGTSAVPTGEIEFNDSEAYLLGDRKLGIYIATEILCISRIDDALTACGIARKSLWEIYLYSTERKSFGKTLIKHPLFQRDLVEMSLDVEGALILSLYAATLFDHVSGERYPYSADYHFARMICSMAKNIASDISIHVTGYCMELMGGIGFLEEFPMARFHRDSLVTSIWEGTSNIQALEFLETVIKKGTDKKLFSELTRIASEIMDREVREDFLRDVLDARKEMDTFISDNEREYNCKYILSRISSLSASILLYHASQYDDADYVKWMASIYHSMRVHHRSPSPDQIRMAVKSLEWMNRPR